MIHIGCKVDTVTDDGLSGLAGIVTSTAFAPYDWDIKITTEGSACQNTTIPFREEELQLKENKYASPPEV